MKHLFLTLMMGVSLCVWSQNSFSGKVTDTLQQPITGATVYLPDLHKTAITDAAGGFAFRHLPAGKLRVSVSALGYASRQETVAVSGETTLDVVLTQSEFRMDEVVVSTAFSRLQSQNVMKIEKQSVADMQKKGAATLIEGLSTLPGVAQVSTGTSIGKPVIRGLSGNRVLVYTQGVRMENQQFGDEHGLGLNDAGVESAEVIKGPASLLYGSDAIGGVIYLNPEKFAEAGAFKADVRQRFFSNTLGSSTSVGVKTSSEKWKFLGRGSYDTHSDYEIPDGDRVTNTRYNEKDLKLATGFSDRRISSVLRYNYNALDLGIPEEGIGVQSNSKSTLYPKQDVRSHILSWGNTLFFADSKLDVNLGYIDNRRKELEDSPTPALDMRLQTTSYDVKYHFPKSTHWEVISGAQGLWQENRNAGEERLIPDAQVRDFGVFTTALGEWNGHTLQTGLRFDTRNVTGNAFGTPGEEGSFETVDRSFSSLNAQVGYSHKIANSTTVRLNVASGFRAPNLAELTSNGVHEGTNRYEVGNANLDKEQNVQVDLDLEYGNSHFECFLNGFYNHIDRYIYAAPTGEVREGNDVYDYVQSNARLFGGEAGFHLHPHPLDWLHLQSTISLVKGERTDGTALPLVPATDWDNSIRVEFKKGQWLKDGYATFDVNYTFEQNRVGAFETPTGDYALFNLGAGGKITLGKTSFLLTMSANNLFDRTYIAHLSRLKTDGIPNIGRNFIVGLSFQL